MANYRNKINKLLITALGLSLLLLLVASHATEPPSGAEPVEIDILDLIQLEIDENYNVKENTESLPDDAKENVEPTKQAIGPTCTQGSERELKQFFKDQDLVQIAKGKRIRATDQQEKISDIFFLLSKDVDLFHVATLEEERRDFFKTCIISSAREIDFQIAPPVPNLLERKYREHLLFLNDLPKEGECPPEKQNCSAWAGPTEFIGNKYLLTGYLYSQHWELDAYTQIVDLTLDSKTIQPTRGMLSEFARTKYAARLRNELNENNTQITAAKELYRDIYNQVDHGHPLYMFILGDEGEWKITMIDRHRGLVWTPLQGNELEIYPLSKREYREFLEEE